MKQTDNLVDPPQHPVYEESNLLKIVCQCVETSAVLGGMNCFQVIRRTRSGLESHRYDLKLSSMGARRFVRPGFQ